MVVCLIAAFLWQSKYRTGGTGGTAVNSIAVLPLQNLNDDFSVDYLRFALADEIAKTLASSRTLDVRSSAVTRKYVGADLDPQQIGPDLHVTTLLTGHFQKQETHLMVTVEAIETGTGRLVWQVNLTGSIQEPWRSSLPRRQGLMPILGAAGGGRAAWRSYELSRLCQVVFKKRAVFVYFRPLSRLA